MVEFNSRTLHDRQICGQLQLSAPSLQQFVAGSEMHRSGLFCPKRLAATSHLLPSNVSFGGSSIGCNSRIKGSNNGDNTMVAGTYLHESYSKNGSLPADSFTKQSKCIPKGDPLCNAGATEKSSLVWRRSRLTQDCGWSDTAAERVVFGYAKSTVQTCKMYIN